MNRGVFQSAVAQEIMAGNPNWWNMNASRSSTTQQASPFLTSSNPNLFLQFPPSSSSTSLPVSSWHDAHEFPESLSHLLLGGLTGDEKNGLISQFQGKKLDSWEDQIFSSQIQKSTSVDIKQENSASSYMHGHGIEEFDTAKQAWPLMVPVSSPQSCVSSFSSNVLDFSKNKIDGRHPPPDRSSECNSTGGAIKKARAQPSSSQTTFKVRKEKLGDRVSTLHQLVSPFGKTDTASVLLEALGYIRFLQSQVEALSLPYLNNSSTNLRQQHSVHGESCIFPEDPGQLVNENYMKRNIISGQDSYEEPKDLRSKGLCLVPVSCTARVVSDNGADYWAPAFNGGFRMNGLDSCCFESFCLVERIKGVKPKMEFELLQWRRAKKPDNIFTTPVNHPDPPLTEDLCNVVYLSSNHNDISDLTSWMKPRSSTIFEF